MQIVNLYDNYYSTLLMKKGGGGLLSPYFTRKSTIEIEMAFKLKRLVILLYLLLSLAAQLSPFMISLVLDFWLH